MKVLLLSPAQLAADGKPLRVKRTFITPLSILLLAGITGREHDVAIANDYSEDIPYDEPWDAVGITTTTLHSARGYQIAAEFRKRGVPVVMGGFHPTLFTDEAMQHADAVCVGEAELVWPRVLDDIAAGRLQRVYKADRLVDLKDQPIPRYDLFKRGKYINYIMPVESTRGCPYDCDFCSVTQFYGRKYRFRPVADVVRDIRAAGTRFIGFVDDNIAGKMSYSAELFEALIPQKIFWMSQVSIRLADDERVLALAARSGFRYAIVGIETLDPKNLEAVGKKKVNRVEDYVEKTRMFKKHGITVAANLMFGFDNDTDATFERTYKFVADNHFMPNPYIVTPYPGTRLYTAMKNAGRVLHDDFWKYTSY
ncbi:B12-binding domain-containing radical SAM protein, partial [bacterium]|nr:B12-binding domain-containing radical SAM protein [bacterium]